MKISVIKVAQISVLSLSLAIFTNFTVAFANSVGLCLEANTDLTNNLCEQNARHLELESNLSLVYSMFPKAEKKVSNRLLIKQLFAAEMKEGIEVTHNEDNLASEFEPIFNSWPRPKVISRSFEFAVNSLDLKGKRDLKSCSILQKNQTLVSEIGWEAHQLDAFIEFSNQKLSGIKLSNNKSDLKHTKQDCESLFGLILGKT